MSPDLRAQSLTAITPTTGYRDDDWNAACASADPWLFHTPGEDGERESASSKRLRTTAALAICADCPIRKRCLEWAIETGDQHAILGGTTPEQRGALRANAKHPRVIAAEKTRATIVDLNRQGVGSEAIAARLHVSTETVWRHMRAAREAGQLEPDVSTRKPPTSDRRCGTTAGSAAHKYRGESSCAACRQALANYRAKRREMTR